MTSFKAITRLGSILLYPIFLLLKTTHHYVAVVPHRFLLRKVTWYKKWHQWAKSKPINIAIPLPYIIVVALSLTFMFKSAWAVQQTWDFSDVSDFVFNSAKIETDGTTARLKAQNYEPDAQTAALFHFDETNGTTANDSSTNINNGLLTDNANFGTGNLNNSLMLDGWGDFVTISDISPLTLNGHHTIETWVKFDETFSTSSNQDMGVVDKGSYKLYYDRTSGKINYELADSGSSTWTRRAGNDTAGSWDTDGKTIVRSTVVDGSTHYMGLGLGTGDAEVWRWNGTAWAQIGGDGVNSSWADQTYEDVNTLVLDGDILYAGLGTNAAGDAEVWSCDTSTGCTDWDKIGGDGINSSWAVNTFEAVFSLTAYGGNIYAGTGVSATDAEVWRWNGTAWTKIGGDGVNSSWNTVYEAVRSLVSDGTNLYAGIGDTAAEAEVWRWNGTSWAKIGGDGIASSWAVADNIEQVTSLSYFGGTLYAGTGLTAGDADVWRYNGTSWAKIGGDGVNTGWAASTYELVAALTNDGTNLYAGLASSNGDGEVWRWNGTAWTKIGGDGVNTGFSTAQGDGVYALDFGGGKLVAGLYDATGNGTSWEWNGTAWTWTGGGHVNKSWGFYNLQSVETSATLNEKLYVGTGVSVAGNAMVWEYNGSSWQIVGGQGVNGSWAPDTFENVFALQVYKGSLYAALGTTANDAEVWRYTSGVWTKIGGDSLNGGWTTNYEQVNSLAVYNGNLYAGLGLTAGDAEVWRYDGTSWTKVGGDGVSSSWATALNIENVLAMTVYDGQLYAGLGSTAGDAEVWRYDGTSWTKVGGDSVASSWDSTLDEVYIMRVYNGKLIAGLGSSTDDAEVWQYDGTSWTKIGGDDTASSWTGGTYERIRAMTIYNGELYVGLGDTAGDGEVWKYDGLTWTQSGGDSLNNGWTNVIEYVTTLIDYKGKLYAGTGNTGNADAGMWSMGNNSFLSSAQSSQDTGWHHIAASYNGSVMRIYIDGTQDASMSALVSVPDNSLPLLVGSTYGSGGRGEGQGFMKGSLDELRISTSARSSFTDTPYSTEKETISLAESVFDTGIEEYTSFATNETLNGGSINYQLSSDDGDSWKFWNGSEWANAVTLADANEPAVVSSHITSLPVSFEGLKWRAVIQSDGNQRVTLNSVTVNAVEDTSAPDTDVANIVAYKNQGGNALTSNAWTNGASPYFSWDAAIDSGAGIYGYCLYLGQDSSADPATTKGLLGTSPDPTGDQCQFVTDETNLDLGDSGLLNSPLITSNTAYHLLVKAIDKAGNMSPSTTEFHFRFDNTPPTNPGFISAPSGFINTKEVTLTWPSTGGQAAADGASGFAGLQYRFNGSSWYGDSHDGTGSNSDLLANDGAYTTLSGTDFADIHDGVNTVYFRTWDNAGNVTTTYVSAALKINTNGAPSMPQVLDASPNSSTQNSFSFDWEAPDVFVGSENSLNYCYTVNVLPSANNCTYTGAGITSLAAGAYASQPGVNTIYIVARDESSNINYDNYASTTFTANTAAPGIPGNLDIVDVSIKASSKWRLAVTWDVPTVNFEEIATYKIYRSTNNSNFSLAGTSSSTTYIDAGLSQVIYYYRIQACDSTNNCSANSSVVSLLPTGKYTEPANIIGDPEVSNVTTKRADISWSTDRGSDSKVAIGTTSGSYGAAEIGNSDQVSAHDIKLENLAAGTTYYYVVKWTDTDGNTGMSQEHTFTTSPAPVVKQVETNKVGLSDAAIQFTSVNATKVKLYYGPSESFGGLQTVNTSSSESAYNIELTGLADGTKYYYQLSAIDSEGTEYKGNIFSFTTPQRPRISNIRFEPVEGQPTSTQSVSWTTNVPSTSTLTYGKVGTAGTDIQNSELKTQHKIVISNLDDDSRYFLIAQSRDQDGNLAVSDQQVFRTALDTRPPTVYDVNIESSIRGSGSEARGQIVVSWKTDEPSTSQVGYAEGSTARTFNNRSSEDTQLATEHIVIISNLPTSKVFSVQVMSFDKARNIGTSEPRTAIIGRANESVLTLIIGTLQRIFGV